MINEIAERLAHQKASLLDNTLKMFLHEKGIDVFTWEPLSIKKQLNDLGLEIITEIKEYETGEVYTFKLCKILDQTSISIPKPTITLGVT